MELLTRDEVKNYLRIDFTDDDVFIDTLIMASRNYCESYLNRPLKTSDMTTETTWNVPETIRLAMLLLISHWYENRLPVDKVNSEVAFSVSALLMQHRHIPI